MLRAVLYGAKHAADAIGALNEMLVKHDLVAGFATLFLGLFDNTRRTLTYVCCGQEPGLVRRAASGLIEELPPTGPVLGGYTGAVFHERHVVLHSGDILTLFTDGLTEAGPSRREMLEIEGVAELLSAAPDGLGANAIAASLIAGVDSLARDAIRDDVCLLIGVVQ